MTLRTHTTSVLTRDGVGLATDVHQPDTVTNDQALTFLLRTPYGRAGSFDAVEQIARYLTNLGHTLVAQDVRGKFDSEGVCAAFTQELDDGADTVSWLAQQEWCTGRIVPTGESYCGFTALTVAASGHPALVAVLAGMTTTKVASDWLNCDDAFRLHLNAEWITMAFGFPGLPADQPWAITDWWTVSDVEQVRTGSADLSTLTALRQASASHEGDEVLAGGLKERAAGLARVPLILWSGYWDPLVRGSIAEFQAAVAARPHQAHHLELRSSDHLGNPWQAAVRRDEVQADRAESLVRCYERNLDHLTRALAYDQDDAAPVVSAEDQRGEIFTSANWPFGTSAQDIAHFGRISIPAPQPLPALPDSGESFVWGTLAANFPDENTTASRQDVVALAFAAPELVGNLVLEGSVQWHGAERIIGTVAQEQPDGRLLRVVEGVATRHSPDELDTAGFRFCLDLGPTCHRSVPLPQTSAGAGGDQNQWWLLLMQEHYPRYLPADQSNAWLTDEHGNGQKPARADIVVTDLALRAR